MKITYLDNSGFAVEINNDLLIFDYYNNRSETGKTFADGVIDFDALEGYDNIYCFVMSIRIILLVRYSELPAATRILII